MMSAWASLLNTSPVAKAGPNWKNSEPSAFWTNTVAVGSVGSGMDDGTVESVVDPNGASVTSATSVEGTEVSGATVVVSTTVVLEPGSTVVGAKGRAGPAGTVVVVSAVLVEGAVDELGEVLVDWSLATVVEASGATVVADVSIACEANTGRNRTAPVT